MVCTEGTQGDRGSSVDGQSDTGSAGFSRAQRQCATVCRNSSAYVSKQCNDASRTVCLERDHQGGPPNSNRLVLPLGSRWNLVEFELIHPRAEDLLPLPHTHCGTLGSDTISHMVILRQHCMLSRLNSANGTTHWQWLQTRMSSIRTNIHVA